MPPSTFIELLRVIISGRSSSWDWAIDNRVPNLRIQVFFIRKVKFLGELGIRKKFFVHKNFCPQIMSAKKFFSKL